MSQRDKLAVAKLVVVGIAECEGWFGGEAKAFQTKGNSPAKTQKLKTAGCVSVGKTLGGEDSLEEGVAVHSSILAWRIPMDRGARQATVHGVAKSWT